MTKELIFLVFVAAGLIFGWFEFLNIRKLLARRREILRTPYQTPLTLEGARPGQRVKLQAPALPSSEVSPITKMRCAWWEFEVGEVTNLEGPLVRPIHSHEQTPNSKWILLSVGGKILPIHADDTEEVHLKSMSWTSGFRRQPPAELSNYLHSPSFKSYAQQHIPFEFLDSETPIQFAEYFLPLDVPIYVHGDIRNLEPGEVSEIENQLRETGIQGHLLEMTIGGNGFIIALKDEGAMLGTLRKKLSFISFQVWSQRPSLWQFFSVKSLGMAPISYQWFPFFTFVIVNAFTPGPNVIMLASSGSTFGFRRTLGHLLGVCFGVPLMFLVVVLGSGQIFDAFPWSLNALTVLSLLYVTWLAWRIAQMGFSKEMKLKSRVRPMNFLEGIAFQWVNGKAWQTVLMAATLFAVETFAMRMEQAGVFWIITFAAGILWIELGKRIALYLKRPLVRKIYFLTLALALLATTWPKGVAQLSGLIAARL